MAISDDIHVGTCTPLVSERTGICSYGVPGQMGCHICLVTSPCSWLTPLTAPAARSASAVMLNIGPLPLS